MAFSIDSVLKYLVDKFQPDLSSVKVLTQQESLCCRTLEQILQETAENSPVDCPQSEEDSCEDDAHFLDSDEEIATCDGTPIEKNKSAEHMGRIWDDDRKLGRAKCLKKHKITYSQLRAIRRHFKHGEAEQLKTEKVRSIVEEEFRKVWSLCPSAYVGGYISQSAVKSNIELMWCVSCQVNSCTRSESGY